MQASSPDRRPVARRSRDNAGSTHALLHAMRTSNSIPRSAPMSAHRRSANPRVEQADAGPWRYPARSASLFEPTRRLSGLWNRTAPDATTDATASRSLTAKARVFARARLRHTRGFHFANPGIASGCSAFEVLSTRRRAAKRTVSHWQRAHTGDIAESYPSRRSRRSGPTHTCILSSCAAIPAIEFIAWNARMQMRRGVRCRNGWIACADGCLRRRDDATRFALTGRHAESILHKPLVRTVYGASRAACFSI